MAIFSLKDLRSQVSPEYARKSDEELVLDYARGTGQDPFEVAAKLGVETGAGKGSFRAGLGIGADQVQSMLAGTGAAIADAAGATGLRDRLEAETRAQQAQALLARNPETPQRIEDVGSIGEFGSYAAGQVGQQVPIMGGILASSALTAATAPALGIGAGVLGTAGALGAGYTYGVGSLYNEALEGGERSTGEAFAKAVPYAAAEALVPLGLGRIARGAVGSNLLTATTRKGAIGQATAGGVVAEGATEGFQTELEMSMRDDLTPEEKASRRLNAVVAGGLVGGGFSGAAGAFAKLPDPNADPEGNDLTSGGDTGVGNELDPETYAEEVAARRRQRQEAARRNIEGGLERDPFEPIPADASPVERQRILEARVEARERSISQAAAQAAADAQQAETLNNQLKELEQLGASRLPESEVESIKAEMKLAQEQLEATRQGFSSAQELAEAEARLNELEAEITAPVPKGTPARQFKQQQRARAAETLEERTGLEATIDTLKQQQFAENQGNAEQALLYELHLEKLQEQLDADAEARFARRAMRRIRGRGIKPSEMTSEQVSEVQADIENRMADREASLSGEPARRTDVPTETTDVETTSPIVELEPEQIDNFVAYVKSFYKSVNNEQLADDDIRQALQQRLRDNPDVPFDSDTTDRELVYNIITKRRDQAKATEPTYEPAPDELFTVARDVGGVNLVEDVAYSDLTAEEKASRQVQDQIKRKAQAAPRGEVVQTTASEEELVTAEDVEEAAAVEDADVEQVLKAEAASGVGAARGRVELPQQVLKGVVEMMRSTKPNPKPIVRQQGSPARDADSTDTFSAKMTEIHEAFKKAVIAARAYNNARQNLVDSKQAEGLSDQGAVDMAGVNAEQLQTLAAETKAAMDELVRVAGSEKTVDALVAVNKLAAQKDKYKSSKVDGKIKPYMKELFGGKSSTDTRGQYINKVDVNLSNAWAAYKDGALEGVAQTAPEGRQKRLSSEEVDAGFIADLETAATEGRGRTKEFGKEKGLRGILNLIGAPGRGTPRVGTLALRKMLIDTLRQRQQDASVKFTDEENSYYDPKDDTVYLRRSTTPEEIVHESLHAALQGYVYRNQTAPEVNLLRETLADVIDFVQRGDLDKVTGMSAQDKQTAIDVVNVLQRVRGQQKKDGTFAPQAELDAVLELISYGNTLAEFKELTTKVKARNAASKTFLESINNVWRYLTELVSKFLGVETTAANDILNSTVSLLNKAKQEGGKPSRRGKVLKQSVRSDSVPLDGSVNPAEFNIDLRNEAADKDWKLSTKVIFDLLGWDKRMKWSGQKMSSLNTYIKKNLPWVETFLRAWEPTLGDKTLQKMTDYMKSDKRNGYLRAEAFAHIIEASDKKLVQSMFDYLDGDKSALNDYQNKEHYQELMDSLRDFLNTYINDLPTKERAKFTARPISESLLFVETKEDIGSQALGKMRKISQMLSRKRYVEDNIEEQLMFDEDGVLNTQDAIYVRAVKRDKDGKEVDKVFARANIANNTGNLITFKNDKGDISQYMVEDPDVKFKVTYTTDKKRFVFTTNMDARQLLNGKARTEERRKLANAVRNTVATLANSYSSGQYFQALFKSGRDEDGKFIIAEDAEPVYVFNSLDEINKYSEAMAEIDGYVPKTYEGQNIPVVGGSETSESRVASALRVSGSYVKFPDNEAIWGELAGKYMSGPVYAAIHDATNKENLFKGDLARKYNTTVRWFKKSKTIYNPSTIVTNVASNVTLMLAHGIKPSTVLKAANLLKRYYINKDLSGAELELVSAFMNSGALLGDFSSQEVKEDISKAFSSSMFEDKAGVQGVVAQLYTLEKAKAEAFKKHIGDARNKATAIDEAAVGFYAYGDNIFRMAAFMERVGTIQADTGTARLTKAQLKDVGIDARKMFLDYDIDSRALQMLRQTIVPFASWTYAIMPVLSKIIITQPWKLVNIMGAYAMIDTVASALVGDDDEETRERMGELYNERLFGIGPHSMIRVPFMGDERNPVYIKLGNYIPLHSTFKGTPNGTFGIEGWPSGLAPTGPIVSAMAMIMNKDSYTGKEIWGSTDTALDRMATFAAQASDIVLPPIIASNARQRYEDALTGKTGITGGRNPTTDPTMLALQAFGLKLYQPNIDEEAVWKQLSAKKAMREYKTAMSRARREMARSGTYDAEALSAELNRLRDDMLEEIDEVLGNK